MAVHDIMTTELVTVSPEDTVETMHKMLEAYPIHHLMVVDERRLLGVISDRDILRVMSPYLNSKVESDKDRFTLTRKASQLMNRKPVSINGGASIQQAARTLIESKVSLLPVLDDDDTLVGVLSWKDVMRFIMD